MSSIRNPERREAREQAQRDRLRQIDPDLNTIVIVAQDVAALLPEQRTEDLDRWRARARSSGLRAMRNFAISLSQDYAAIRATDLP